MQRWNHEISRDSSQSTGACGRYHLAVCFPTSRLASSTTGWRVTLEMLTSAMRAPRWPTVSWLPPSTRSVMAAPFWVHSCCTPSWWYWLSLWVRWRASADIWVVAMFFAFETSLVENSAAATLSQVWLPVSFLVVSSASRVASALVLHGQSRLGGTASRRPLAQLRALTMHRTIQ